MCSARPGATDLHVRGFLRILLHSYGLIDKNTFFILLIWYKYEIWQYNSWFLVFLTRFLTKENDKVLSLLVLIELV